MWESLMAKQYLKSKKKHDLHLILQDQAIGDMFVSK
jgi:hypothetical protein